MIKEQLSYVHSHGAPAKGKILMVASSPTTSQQTGWPIGFWAAELTHPLRVFQEAANNGMSGPHRILLSGLRDIDFRGTVLSANRLQWMRNNYGFTANKDVII